MTASIAAIITAIAIQVPVPQSSITDLPVTSDKPVGNSSSFSLVGAPRHCRRRLLGGFELRDPDGDSAFALAKLIDLVLPLWRAVHHCATGADAPPAEQHHCRARQRTDDDRRDHKSLEHATYYSIVGEVPPRLRRALVPAGAALVLASILALAAPEAAGAHAYLVRSTPQAGERLTRSPASLLLYFSEPFVEGSERISLRRVGGERVNAPVAIRGGTLVRQPLPSGLRGVVVVHWSVLSDDGHPSLGEFAFAVGDADELPRLGAAPSQPTSWGQTAAVWLFFAGLALALGGLVSERLIWRADADVAGPPVLLGLFIAANGALLHLGVLAADRAGGLAELRSPADLALALDTRAGRLTLTILLLLGVAAAAARWNRSRPLAILALLATSAASAARGHSGTSGHGWAVPADAVHLAAAAIWIGALIHLLRVLYSARGEGAREARERLAVGVRGYASLAFVTVLIAVGGGILTALAQFGSVQELLDTGYGRTLIVKGALIGAALAVALAARTRALAFGWRGGPLIGRLTAYGLASGAVTAALFAAVLGPGPLRIVATALFAGLLLYAAVALRRGLGTGSQSGRPAALITGIGAAFVALNAGGVAATAAASTTATNNGGGDAIPVIRLLALALAAALAIAALLRALPENGALRLGLLRRLASAESSVLVAALAAAALLVNVAPPRAAVAAAEAAPLGPPPLTGPAIRLADFTGQIAVGLTATARQLRFELVVPGEGAHDARLKAEAEPTGKLSADLYPRRCGEGCFTIRYRLPRGTTTITATVGVPGLEGGKARFVVPWPPRRERPELLRRVARTMFAVRELEMTELVVSGGSSSRTPGRYRLPGKRLLRTAEMYRGGAVDVRVLGRDGGLTLLAFALPASQIWYRMWVDVTYRVRREVIINRGHLITRTFAYPRGK